MKAVRLANRALLSLQGSETIPFLQGLLSKDLNGFSQSKCLYSFLLNAKGRIVSDLIVYKNNDENILLEADADKLNDLERLLKLYRLRKKIDISRPKDDVSFIFPESKDVPDDAVDDPRLGSSFGKRYIGKIEGFNDLKLEDYTRRRLEFGIGEGSDELLDQIPLNVNGDILGGVDFDKGCYIGQELVARTHHTGIIRKRIMPFRTIGKPKEGSNVVDLEGKRRGKIVKAMDGIGIAVISLEAVGTNVPMISELKEKMEFRRPDWWPSTVKLGPPQVPS